MNFTNIEADKVSDLFKQAYALHQQGRFEEAEYIYKNILQVNPDHADSLHLSGLIRHKCGHTEQAVRMISDAIRISQSPIYYSNLGVVFKENAKYAEAMSCFQKAIEIKPDLAEAYSNIGNTFLVQARPEEALPYFHKAIEINPKLVEVCNSIGQSLADTSRHQEALTWFQKAIALNPQYDTAYYNMGNALQSLGRFPESIESFQKAAELNPKDHKAYYGIGNSLLDMKKMEEAISYFRKSLELYPDLSEAYSNIIHLSQQICDWDTVEKLSPRFDELVNKELALGKRVSETPLVNLSKEMNSERNLAIAKSWGDYLANSALRLKKSFSFDNRKHKKKIIIGYLSHDFCNHPVAHLMLGIFALHDRSQVEVFCYSYGSDDNSLHRNKIMHDADKFIDIRNLNISDAADRIYQDGVDILIDLMGHTKNCRPQICALRPAPIMVTYLGYPGTTGASFFDYVIVDKIVVPEHYARFYSEKLVYMPHCYQANDHKQIIADKTYTRADFGIPKDAFVFCSFNQNYKIESKMFDVWMQILNQIPGSVLWLLDRGKAALENLKKEAQKRGIAPDRLIFAGKLGKTEHLARQHLADLILDTRIYTGHTTTSDALWTGVPVVTLEGDHFASRVSSSILRAMGLTKLVTHNLNDFETLAVKLAKDSDLLNQIRQKIAKNRLTEPLFDTPRFVRNLEIAYQEMWKIFVSGHKPQQIQVIEKAISHKRVPKTRTMNVESELKQAFVLHQAGKLDEAEAIYDKILESYPSHADALHLCGVAAHQQGNNDKAIPLIRQAIQHVPNNAAYYSNLGAALQVEELLDEAIDAYRKSVELSPNHVEAWLNMGSVLKTKTKYDDAIACFMKVLEIQPNYPDAYSSMGLAYRSLGKTELAMSCFQKALEIKPDYVEVLNNIGLTLQEQSKLDEAVGYFNKAISIKPNHLSSLNNLGVVLQAQRKYEEAIAAYKQAIDAKPSAEPYLNMGNVYKEQADIDNSIACYEAALKIKPNYPEAYGSLFHQLQHACEWTKVHDMSEGLNRLNKKGIESGKKSAEVPFVNLTRSMNLAENFAVVRSWNKELVESVAGLNVSFSFEARKGLRTEDLGLKTHHSSLITHHSKKLRVGYLSYDFRNHPVAHLMLGVFGLHNRNEFEIIGYYYGKNDDTDYRKRIGEGCDKFIDLTGLSHADAARRIYQDETDILIDLMGYTENKWLEIFALHPAPIQATYLGYPGTTGGQFMDYIITDQIASPPEHADFYAEKFVYLPHCYQVTDESLKIPHRPWKRKHFRLPENAFVFCSFNHTYKIELLMFDVWMRIMKQIPDSVLWLSKKNPRAENNLKMEAEKRGIIGNRLIFADRLTYKEEHLTRHGFADLALDTRIYNGHTTTSDALWSGVPVVTLQGGHFPSRAASSLLNAVGLPELITRSLEEYESLVLKLAKNSDQLLKIRQKLAKNRLTSPLFNTALFVKNLERAFHEMWKIFASGEKPRLITVQSAKCEVQNEPQTSNLTLNTSSGYYGQLGMKLKDEGRFDEAIATFQKAIEIKADLFDVHGNMGNVYLGQGKPDKAVECYRKVLELKPDSFEAYNNMGNAYLKLNKFNDALIAFQKAIEIKPDLAEAYNNMGTAYKGQDKVEEAFPYFQKAIELKPDLAEAYSNYVPHLQALCHWDQLAVFGPRLDEITRKSLEKGLKAAETPFESLTRFSDPALNLKVAASWGNHIAMPMKYIRTDFDFEKRKVGANNNSPIQAKINIGYLSNDFCNHPVGHLTVSMFGLHNRNNFNIFAYSYGVNDNSYFRKRIEQECDRFVDIRDMNHQEAANLIYADGVDILVDLMGYTKDNRLEICAFRPAPIQITWLGYPGTSGANFFDYIIADKIIAPPEHEPYFSEKPILMPHTYLIGNHTQQISDKKWQRKDFGIPELKGESAFVFCSFNQSYKIEPVMFDVWMRILKQIPESVLWLSFRYPTAAANLKKEAEKLGVSASRLIFAEKLNEKADYLARLGFADLALDTRLYNGHATSSDALWAGVPVITLLGGHFASRVASSVLNAVGLPELITHSLKEYEERILYLYHNPSELQRIRQKLAKNRLTYPLFDTPKFVQYLETAYEQTWKLFLSGEKPKRIELHDAAQQSVGANNYLPLLEAALRFHQSGQMDAAKQQYEKILQLSPNHPDALHLFGVLHHQQGKNETAIEFIRKAIGIVPESFLFHGNFGAAFHALKRYDEALSCYRKSLELNPNHHDAMMNMQKILKLQEQSSPDIKTEINKGLKYQQSGQMKEAADCYQNLLFYYPNHPDVLHLLGIVEHFFGNDEKSLNLIQKAIELNPKNPACYSNLGNTLRELGKHQDALFAYQKSVEMNPSIAEVYVNMGLIHQDTGNIKEAILCYIKALDIKPDLAEACSYLVSQLKATFQWSKLSHYSQQLERLTLEALSKGLKPAETPFDILSRCSDPKLNFDVAQAWSLHISKMMEGLKTNSPLARVQERVKIGYLSCDFRNHPVTHLIFGLLKHHHREKFEIFGYAYGGSDPTDWQHKIAQSFDHFTDIHTMTHVQAAQRIHQDNIDILIDLTGHTKNNRLSICALRPARIQAAYLGFPGTSGADFFDYILTDKIVSPAEHEAYYSEKFVYLPHCYIIYDNTQPIADKKVLRTEELGLRTENSALSTQHSLVFCSFNQPYKVEPKIFDVWMKILAKVPDSVLWLSERDEDAHQTLRHEAEIRGISGNRLIFASKAMVREDYLSRLMLADLALDTMVYNGHATTADALWAGVPVITVQGNHFASRVASSILNAVGLPELICQSLQDYETLVIKLAKNPDELIRLRQKLAKNRLTSPMFDTPNMVKDIEQAYQTMWQIFSSGQAHHHIEIARFDPNAELANAFRHHQAGRLSEAKVGYERILQAYPNHAETLQLYGVIAHQQKNNEQAVMLIKKAIAVSPNSPTYWNNLGIVLHEMNNYEESAFHYKKAIELAPDYSEAYHNLGFVLKMQGKWDEAFLAFQKAVEINPNYADVYNGMGMIRQNQDRIAESLEYFQKAVQINPNLADAYYNMANSFSADHQNGIAAYRKALEIQPDHTRALANLYHRLIYTCSWDDIERLSPKVDAMLENFLKAGQKTSEQPLMSVIWKADPARNLAVAKSWANHIAGKVKAISHNFSFEKAEYSHRFVRANNYSPLRIGYLSNDFRNHPVAHLISGLFKLHDRREFEVFCYSYCSDDGGFYRKKIQKDCDCFADIRQFSHADAARRIYEDHIHILVDLTGYTKGIKMEICAMRPAPIQVNYLGFPGTSGADFFDYIIVDKTIAPHEHARYYTEKLIYMPHSYQVNDHEQAFSDKIMTRADMGISQNSFVFCSFTQAYKIDRIMFDVWMKILKQIPDGILWLLPESPLTEANLRRETEKRGVDPARLIFAKRFDKPEHLTRHTLADLVLDTRIYNGHTTTSDALWAGVPVIALEGTHFASRVAAGLLKAIGLPQLITHSLEEYEKLAVRLAQNSEELLKFRQQLAKNRMTEPLFDTPRFAKDIESAYKEMWKIWLAGEKPKDISVGDLSSDN